MTDKTVTFGVRVPIETKKKLTGVFTRKALENITRQIDSGEITVSDDGIDVPEISCDTCPYMNDLNLDGLYEVSKFKNIDPQKALDRCVQVLWR